MLGFRLFLHALRMVLGNLGAALRISMPVLVYFIALLALGYALFGMTSYTAGWNNQAGWMAPDGALSGAMAVFALVAAVGGAVAFLWTATAWHRYILLEEIPGALGPALNPSAMWRYLKRLVLLALILVLVFMLFGIVGAAVGTVLATAMSPFIVGVVVLLIVYVPPAIIGYRLSPVLPAAASGADLSLSQAWTATHGASGGMLVLALLTVVVGWALQRPLVALEVTAPALAGILSIAVQWISSIVGVSILTTLYGHFVERRPLNA